MLQLTAAISSSRLLESILLLIITYQSSIGKYLLFYLHYQARQCLLLVEVIKYFFCYR